MTRISKTFLPLIASFLLVATAAEAAGVNNTAQLRATESVSDPIEPFNRAVFQFNQAFDKFVFIPVAKGYRYVTPRVVRNSIGNVTDNLFEPVSMIHAFLQGDVTQGVTSFWRFILNTTIGFVGVNDVASEFGLKPRTEDFGQTLATWGVGSGPYIVLPILGPSNLRDTVGQVGDVYTNPFWYYLDTSDAIIVGGVRSLVVRERLLDPIDDINETSLDPYVTFRSIYLQRRAAQISNRTSNSSMLDGNQ